VYFKDHRQIPARGTVSASGAINYVSKQLNRQTSSSQRIYRADSDFVCSKQHTGADQTHAQCIESKIT